MDNIKKITVTDDDMLRSMQQSVKFQVSFIQKLEKQIKDLREGIIPEEGFLYFLVRFDTEDYSILGEARTNEENLFRFVLNLLDAYPEVKQCMLEYLQLQSDASPFQGASPTIN